MKKTVWILAGTALIVSMWYLFMRPFEFQAKFTVKTLPGDIIQTIRIWDRSLDNAEIVEVDSIFSLTQDIVWRNRTYMYKWNFETVNDSTTGVNVTITQPNRRLLNKLLVPFTDQHIERDARHIVKTVYDILNMHLKITKVSVLGESEIAPVFCVCRTVQTQQIEKANGMMRHYGLLTSFIRDFNLEPDGPPIIKVHEWNHTLGSLKYDFCFPIVEVDSLPEEDGVAYRKLRNEKVLRAVYHGNYITSDRAWYALIRFAQSNGYEIDGLPIEYFYNNPTLGLNEKEWKAEVFLPIK